MRLAPGFRSLLTAHRSLSFNDSIGSSQNIQRNRQADLLCGFQMMTNSNFVGCSTGRSAGLAPLRILSAIDAPRL
jgi:hypothetical protein